MRDFFLTNKFLSTHKLKEIDTQGKKKKSSENSRAVITIRRFYTIPERETECK